MKIVLVVGSGPQGHDGIGDYTSVLAEGLCSEGADAVVVRNRLRTPRDFASFRATIKAINPDVTHMQYPNFGFGYSLLPQLAANLIPMVVTIHEVSQAHPLRKLSLFGFSFRSQRLVFTSQFELDCALRAAPWIRTRSVVIPIGANVSLPEKYEGVRSGIAYFGLIRPDKGIESFLELSRRLSSVSAGFRAYMFGAVPEVHAAYYQRLRELSRTMPLEWIIGLDHRAVAERLTKMSLGYLPYPDGASERRASLLAMFAARVPVITTRGSQTPGSFEDMVAFASSTDEAMTKASQILGSTAVQTAMRDAGWAYLMKRNWSVIAQRHISLYDEILARRRFV